MKIDSPLSSKEYMHGIRNHLSSFSDFGMERYTGIIIGRLFWVTYHSGYEWNRKITGEINRAWGFVREKDGATEVRFIRGKGLLAPSWMLFITILGVLTLCFNIGEMMTEYWPACFAISLVVGVTTAIQASFTENGIAGEGEITRFLRDPKEYYC